VKKDKDIKFRWVWSSNGTDRLYEVGILADGTLHNPRNYPDDLVRTAVLAAIERMAQWRSEAAQKAAATRARRRGKKLYTIIEKLRLGHKYGPTSHCVVCNKGLGDPESISRGIGSDCWQEILKRLEQSESTTAST
jgi:Family of unknown function (DUF6011)